MTGNRIGGFSTPYLGRILLDPDPNGLSGGIPTSDPAPTSDPSPAPDGGLGVNDNPAQVNSDRPDWRDTTGTTGSTLPAPTNPAAPTTQSEWQSIRDAASALGYQFGQEVQDDRAALAHLIRQANQTQQASFYARLGQQLAPHAQGIHSYLQQQQAPAQPQRPDWEPPQFDERYLALVDRDPATGLYLAKPGVPPEIARSVNEYAEWQKKFNANPAAMLDKMVESRAAKIVDERLASQFQQREQQSAIQQIVQQNAAWLYQTDQATGRPLVGADGRYVPTPAGAAYMSQIQILRQAGVTDPRMQDSIAQQIVRAQIAASQQANPGNPNPQTQQAQTRPNVNPNQARPPQERRNTPAATEPTTTGMSLSDLLRQELAAEGITDNDFANLAG